MNKIIETEANKILSGELLERAEIELLSAESKNALMDMLYWSNRIREQFFGKKIKVCSIVPGRVGGCDQDCAFCAQSSRYKTHITKTTILSDEEIFAAAASAKENGVPHLGIVYSGKAISENELDRVCRLSVKIRQRYGIKVCAGLGILSEQQMKRLADAGVGRYNHNLETSRSHYGKIVSTHSYDDRIRTIEAAKRAGLGLCTGGIFGIGESESDRIDMAMEIRRLEVDMVPMNFLLQIPGTPLAGMTPFEPDEILRQIALYRFILPRTHLKIAAGRMTHLRDLHSWVFLAGATSIMSGNYLTTAGRAVKEDLQMLKDLGLEAEN